MNRIVAMLVVVALIGCGGRTVATASREAPFSNADATAPPADAADEIATSDDAASTADAGPTDEASGPMDAPSEASAIDAGVPEVGATDAASQLDGAIDVDAADASADAESEAESSTPEASIDAAPDVVADAGPSVCESAFSSLAASCAGCADPPGCLKSIDLCAIAHTTFATMCQGVFDDAPSDYYGAYLTTAARCVALCDSCWSDGGGCQPPGDPSGAAACMFDCIALAVCGATDDSALARCLAAGMLGEAQCLFYSTCFPHFDRSAWPY